MFNMLVSQSKCTCYLMNGVVGIIALIIMVQLIYHASELLYQFSCIHRMASSSLNCLSNSYSCKASTDMVSRPLNAYCRRGFLWRLNELSLTDFLAMSRRLSSSLALASLLPPPAAHSLSCSRMSAYLTLSPCRHTPSSLLRMRSAAQGPKAAALLHPPELSSSQTAVTFGIYS